MLILSFFFSQEIDVSGNKKSIVIFVPVPQLKAFQKIQVRLVRELEKKFSGKHVVFVAQVSRKIKYFKAFARLVILLSYSSYCNVLRICKLVEIIQQSTY